MCGGSGLVNNPLPSASAASCDLIAVQLSKFAFLRKTDAEGYRYMLVVQVPPYGIFRCSRAENGADMAAAPWANRLPRNQKIQASAPKIVSHSQQHAEGPDAWRCSRAMQRAHPSRFPCRPLRVKDLCLVGCLVECLLEYMCEEG